MTQELIDQARTSDMGKEAVNANEKMREHRYVADIAVAKISKNLEKMEEIERGRMQQGA
jgi:hypothetical protein